MAAVARASGFGAFFRSAKDGANLFRCRLWNLVLPALSTAETLEPHISGAIHAGRDANDLGEAAAAYRAGDHFAGQISGERIRVLKRRRRHDAGLTTQSAAPLLPASATERVCVFGLAAPLLLAGGAEVLPLACLVIHVEDAAGPAAALGRAG